MDTSAFQEMARLEGQHWWFVARRQIVTKALQSVSLPPNARLLEAGSGTGGNLAMLARFGEVAAFEPSPLARDFAKQQFAGEILHGSLPHDLPFEGESYDVVAALDVLEHLDDDEASLKALADLLKPGGHAILTVPAFPFLWSAHDEVHHHHRRYRRQTFLATIERAGLKPVQTTYYNTILFAPAVVVRMVKKLLGKDTADMDSLPWPPLNRLLTMLFGLERHVVTKLNLPLGLSLLAIAEKPMEQADSVGERRGANHGDKLVHSVSSLL